MVRGRCDVSCTRFLIARAKLLCGGYLGRRLLGLRSCPPACLRALNCLAPLCVLFGLISLVFFFFQIVLRCSPRARARQCRRFGIGAAYGQRLYLGIGTSGFARVLSAPLFSRFRLTLMWNLLGIFRRSVAYLHSRRRGASSSILCAFA